MRTGRTNGTNTYEYSYNGSQLMRMVRNGVVVDFTYINGIPATISFNGNTFYYVVNGQGDVTGITDSQGNLQLSYYYDAWGTPYYIYATGNTYGSTLLTINPIMYRGYVFDRELGMYYLQSRYYIPQISRFLNADSVIAGVNGSIQGYNMFGYCFNNPVNMSDSYGHWPQFVKDAANWVNNSVVQPVANFFSPSTNTISGQFQEGIVHGSGSLTGGYSEANGRLQVNSKDSKNNGMLGGFGKVSVGNTSGKVGIGNDDVSLSLKGVGDGLTATGQAGIQYKNGAGLAAKAKAAVLSGRATAELDLYGWQIEVGVSGDFLSAGAEAMIGFFPEEGFTAKASAGAGWFGGGFVFRIKPAQ